MTPVVRAHAVSKTFGAGALATRVLDAVGVRVDPGELVLLMGPSGSGKTTLVSLVAGLLRPDAGEIDVCGIRLTDVDDAARARARREKIGFVFQTYNLFPALTALDNVAVAFRMRGRGWGRAREESTRALDAVGLASRGHHRPGDLSAGQKQRVAIARALAGDPPLLIGDEPTAALDAASANGVMDILRARTTGATGALIVTHDHRLERWADRVVHLEDGRVIAPAAGRSVQVGA